MAALVAATAAMGPAGDAQQAQNRPENAQQRPAAQRGGQKKERAKERTKGNEKQQVREAEKAAQQERAWKKARAAQRKGAQPEWEQKKARGSERATERAAPLGQARLDRVKLNQYFTELAREVQLNRRHTARLERLRALAKKKGDKARLKEIAGLVDRETNRHSRISLVIEEKMGEKYFALAMKKLKADMTNIKRKRVVGEGKKP
ncbi:MAG: hypothetical protein O7B99_03495 [Planctomycetota bacterium]|nr:hypothetical protein [Planctomycetota bacterium]